MTTTIAQQFAILADFFTREKIDFAIIGGYALHAYGHTRATRDVDFITDYEHQARIVAFLESLGFETLHRSLGYSNHLHVVDGLRIDLVYVEGNTAQTILTAAKPMLITESLSLPVARADHLVLLKLFAMRNDPTRKFQELADIRELILRAHLDRDEMRRHFAKHGFEALFDEMFKEPARP